MNDTLASNIDEYLREEQRDLRDAARVARNHQNGRTAVYLQAGQLELHMTDPVALASLLRLRGFIDGLIESGNYS